MSSISTYLWYAYDRTTAAASAALDTVKNIKSEDVVNAAAKVKNAASNVLGVLSQAYGRTRLSAKQDPAEPVQQKIADEEEDVGKDWEDVVSEYKNRS